MDEKIELISNGEEIDFVEPMDAEPAPNLTETENSSLNLSEFEDGKDDDLKGSDGVEEMLLEQKSEFSEVFETKRKELDKIQNDLNELMDRLNTFIADAQEQDVDCVDDADTSDVQNCDEEFSEKQDGPQEKELIKQKGWSTTVPVDEMYVSDGLNPPEINWDILAPFIQNVVGDLKKIRNLNQMTSSVLQRIRNITGVTSLDITEEN